MRFKFNDGGRSKYFKASNVGDCCARAFSIASGRDYKEVYDMLKKVSKTSPRNGIFMKDAKVVAEMLGAAWVPLMGIGTGCTAHLKDGEIPMRGSIVCRVTKHYTAVIDGVINDTYDPSKNGTRCVYGYWKF